MSTVALVRGNPHSGEFISILLLYLILKKERKKVVRSKSGYFYEIVYPNSINELSIQISNINFETKFEKKTHTQIEAQCKNKSKTEFNKLTTNLQKLKLGTVLLARKIIQVLNFANAYMF